MGSFFNLKVKISNLLFKCLLPVPGSCDTTLQREETDVVLEGSAVPVRMSDQKDDGNVFAISISQKKYILYIYYFYFLIFFFPSTLFIEIISDYLHF